MGQWARELRNGIRTMRAQWRFSLVAIATLAIGIGLSTTLFTVVHAAWIRPLPFANPEQLVRVDVILSRPEGPSEIGPSLDDVRVWRTSSRAATHGAIDRGASRLIVDAGTPERLRVSAVSEGYFEMLGLTPVAGRAFLADEMRQSHPLVVMLGHHYWQTRLNGDPGVLGRTVRVDNKPAEVVGIVPKGVHPDVSIWLPFRNVPSSFRGTGADVILRLRAGVSHDAARTILAEDLRAAGHGDVVGVDIASLREGTVSGARATLKTLSAAVAAILLLACVNVGGLQLARGTNRRRELAVRASLGASRTQLIRMLLSESVVLGVAGGAAGVLLAWLSLDGLVALLPLDIPATASASLNTPVLLFAAGVSLVTAVGFGTLPALRLSRVRMTDALSSSDRGGSGSLSRRGGQSLIAIEVALAVVLLAGAGLMVRSFVRLAGVELGFDPDSFLALEVSPVDTSPATTGAYYPALIDAVRALPEVAEAGGGNQLPIGGGRRAGTAWIPGRDPIRIDVRIMTPGYFEAVGLPVRAGQLPTAAGGTSGRLVVVLNERAAQVLFPGETAIGRLVPFRSYSSDEVRPFEVVAVISDTLQDGARFPVRPNVYTLYQGTESLGERGLVVFVRPRGNVTGLADRLRATAESIGPRVIVDRVRSGTDYVSDSIAVPRRRMLLLGLLGAVGLTLAVVGIFSVTAFAVSRRSTEIGVRMALGARPAVVVRNIVADVTWPIAAGLAAGLAGSYVASQLVASFLFETSARDGLTFAAAAAVLAAASLMAAWLPARKAALIDPVSAMRAD
jgi:putative ABC transport system permease protein